MNYANAVSKMSAGMDLNYLLKMLKSSPPRPDQINWPKNQRKNRKNARRRFAAGDKNAFKK